MIFFENVVYLEQVRRILKLRGGNTINIDIYTLMKDDIINCFYRPGEYLEEKFLAEKYKVSRTPVRESLGVLRKEGWIEKHPKKGICTSNITLKQVKDLFQIRYEIEPIMLMFSFKFFSRDFLLDLKNQLLEAIEENDLEKLSNLDDILHDAILSNTNNDLAKSLFKSITEHTKRFRHFTYEDREETLKSGKEHIILIDEILNNNLENALEVLKKHIDNNQLYFMKNIKL